MDAEYEWDGHKNLSNQRKHKVGFDVALLIWDGFVYEGPDRRADRGEERICAIGEIEGRAVFVAYTWRNGRRRIISARKADRDEQRSYRQALARRSEVGEG
ncbi:BrnT family toxin [Skermanella sp. TT6]|uniref:BrnT family toxin n=1 Tax=Skermanella cutis TaxID=2775420 RepID=A0ABX7B5I0_9PROT|nr:BrnT family toxin [Skermanella sp. TT6]QQP89572.1 BrnT family toxin [Skermanella sp. TT6]